MLRIPLGGRRGQRQPLHLVPDQTHDLHIVLVLPGNLGCEHLPEDHRVGVDVGHLVELLALQDLRRHPCRRPRRTLRLDHLVLPLERQPKVAQLDLPSLADEDVEGLEISVDDGGELGVEVGHGLRHSDGHSSREGPLEGFGEFSEKLEEVHSINDLCHDGEVLETRPDVLHDVGVLHLGEDGHLGTEVLHYLHVQRFGEELLYGERPSLPRPNADVGEHAAA
mmetsp:Transcript_4201/g.9111  ORF Transcript_4201/g.9111 Transcript_4201/m.9111 type:complete len:223 (+) Transcript_4201:166-834(+)